MMPHREVKMPEEKVNDFIRDAEKSKARVFATPGKDENFNHRATFVDENFIAVGAYLEDTLVSKIKRGDYVDFSKLIPKDRILSEEDQRPEMVIRGGRTFYVPVNDSPSITSFQMWEQAFRVYANIYTKENPHHSSELIEYNHIIHTIASNYHWDNVYAYDKEFRIHVSKNPYRNWGMILHQAWALRLRDRIHHNSGQSGHEHNYSGENFRHGQGNGHKSKSSEPCRRYNKGRCPFGADCHYEHKCSTVSNMDTQF